MNEKKGPLLLRVLKDVYKRQAVNIGIRHALGGNAAGLLRGGGKALRCV